MYLYKYLLKQIHKYGCMNYQTLIHPVLYNNFSISKDKNNNIHKHDPAS